MSKITTVVFDIGKVLVGFDWQAYIGAKFDPDTVSHVNEAMWGGPNIWNEMDRGILNEDEILEEMISRDPAYKDEITSAFNDVGTCVTRTDFAIPWVEELKAKGYRVLFLSNYSQHVTKCNREALDFVDHMDGGVWSWTTGLVKPFHKIYWILLSKYDLSPDECVFVDDNPANIKAADHVGMKTILFEGYETSHVRLEELLKEDSEAE